MTRFLKVTNKIKADWLKDTKLDRNEFIRDRYLEGHSFGDIVPMIPKAGFEKISRQRIGKIWMDYYRHLKENRQTIDKSGILII